MNKVIDVISVEEIHEPSKKSGRVREVLRRASQWADHRAGFDPEMPVVERQYVHHRELSPRQKVVASLTGIAAVASFGVLVYGFADAVSQPLDAVKDGASGIVITPVDHSPVDPWLVSAGAIVTLSSGLAWYATHLQPTGPETIMTPEN